MAMMNQEETNDASNIVSLDELNSCGINEILNQANTSDAFAVVHPIRDRMVDETGVEQKALRLIYDILNIHLNCDDRESPFGPMIQTTKGRSCTASDFSGEQNDILAEYIACIEHPVLRARVADVVFHNDRKKGEAGRAAVEAYANIVSGRLSGSLHRTHFDDTLILDMADLVQRLMIIAARVYRKGELPSEAKKALHDLFNRAIETTEYVAFVKAAEVARAYTEIDWQEIVDGAETIAASARVDDYPMALQQVWEIAERGYKALGNEQKAKDCQVKIVEQDLRMLDQVGQASARAYWVRNAINKLRRYGGHKERVGELRSQLRALENESLDDFAGIPYKLDLAELASGTVELFEKLTLPDIFLNFAMLDQPQSKAELEKEAEDRAKDSFFTSLFGGSYADRDGKVVAQTHAMPDDEEGKIDWYKAKSLMRREIHRQHVVGGKIEPAREVVMASFGIEPRHFLPIVQLSPFVQDGYELTFANGFARMWQGDFITAASLLIPQLENSIRHVLVNANRYNAKMMNDTTQDDLSLSSLLENVRDDLDAVFGVDLVHEIDLLFNYRPGPALRHAQAHGKLSDGLCYSANVIYGCWLIYLLTCCSLFPIWKEEVAPLIEKQAY